MQHTQIEVSHDNTVQIGGSGCVIALDLEADIDN